MKRHNLRLTRRKRFFFAIIVSAFIFLLFEGGIRVYFKIRNRSPDYYRRNYFNPRVQLACGEKDYETGDSPIYESHPYLPYVLRPHVDVLWKKKYAFQEDKVSIDIEINSLGFRGPEIAVPKPAGVLRIAFLGASTTFCAEVCSDRAAWPHLVIENLKTVSPGQSFDYINAGVPGYLASTSMQNLVHRVAPLEPDIIVIYHATNDLAAETRKLAIEQGLYVPGDPPNRTFSISSLAISPMNPDLIFAGSVDAPYHDICPGEGVFFSNDGGDTWHQINEELPISIIYALTPHPTESNVFYAGSSGTSIYRIILS